jgi:NDP-sugar pyrophosphorylase family protein
MTMLPVAILAGGLGVRLLPVTQTIPKALVNVRGEPFLAHQLRLLRTRGIERVVICLGHLGDRIRQFAGDGSAFGLTVGYSDDGPELLGTAGAVRRALPLLGAAFFVTYGDSFLPCDYAAVQHSFLAAGKPALMTVHRNEGKWDSSNVEFTCGRIVTYNKVVRTSAMRHIDYGLGVFRQSAFAGGQGDLAALYQDLLAAGDLAGYEVTERFYEVGSFQGIRDLESYLEAQ